MSPERDSAETEDAAGELPFLSLGLEKISGRSRERPEDFVVVERLAYEPSGEGTHSYVRIRKTGLSSFEALRRMSRALRRKERDFGYAGLKDKHAVSEQSFSLEHVPEGSFEALKIPGIEVLDVRKHGNKLKLGHLAGNAFRLRLRGVRPGDAGRARAILSLLEERGLPNWFGMQRFGREAKTPELGRRLLREDWDGFLDLLEATGGGAEGRRALEQRASGTSAEEALRCIAPRFSRLCTSALQSEVFNEVLRGRFTELDRLRDGDVAMLHRNAACFAVERAADEQARAQSFEISPTGPLPGPACLRPEGASGELEESVLAKHGLRHEDFDVPRRWGQKGARRALRVPLTAIQLGDEREDGGELVLDLSFDLPRGSYATIVLAELFQDASFQGRSAPPRGF